MVLAVLFDFGGVISTSPFEAFAKYEEVHGIPVGTIRSINSENPDDNAWAKFERSEVDQAGFAELFEQEASKRGVTINALDIFGLLEGDIRPEMITAIERCREHLKVACLTNNVTPQGEIRGPAADVLAKFDVVVESSVVGIRKPEPRFYEIACEMLHVDPTECVFLDDLGINLKPARAMGMHTIKVVDPAVAIAELESVVGFSLREHD